MRDSKDSELLRSCKVDRISQLPDHVIDTILIRLPIADAARTSALSSKWKERWNNISHLSFGLSFALRLKKSIRRFSISTIQNILLLHSGTIVGFKLSIGSASCSEIDLVFRCLSTKCIQDLDIYVLPEPEPCILPMNLYSCLQLRCLKLSRCVLNPPCNFGGFSKIVILRLYNAEIANSLFENFISKCPLLEELDMSSVSFKEFAIIKINARNLKYFRFKGYGSCFHFMSAPLLKDLAYHIDDFADKIKRYSEFEGFKKSYLDEFCNALPTLESLIVDSSFLQTLEVHGISSKSTRHPKSLHQLKVLHAFYIRFWNKDNVTSLLGLIGSLPNLEILIIKGDKYRSSYNIDNPFESLGSHLCDFSCDKLQWVSVSFIGEHNSELDIVKLLLSKSPQLKLMTINQWKRENTEKQLNMVNTVTQFKRASTAATIIFKKLG